VDQAAPLRLVISGVPDRIFQYAEVVVEEEPDFSRPSRELVNIEAPDEQVRRHVDGILAFDPKLQLGMMEAHRGNQRVRPVPKVPHPPGILDPAENAVHPYPEPEGVSLRVVLHADVGEIDVPHAVRGIEIHQQRTVPQWQVPGHRQAPFPVIPHSKMQAPAFF